MRTSNSASMPRKVLISFRNAFFSKDMFRRIAAREGGREVKVQHQRPCHSPAQLSSSTTLAGGGATLCSLQGMAWERERERGRGGGRSNQLGSVRRHRHTPEGGFPGIPVGGASGAMEGGAQRSRNPRPAAPDFRLAGCRAVWLGTSLPGTVQHSSKLHRHLR